MDKQAIDNANAAADALSADIGGAPDDALAADLSGHGAESTRSTDTAATISQLPFAFASEHSVLLDLNGYEAGSSQAAELVSSYENNADDSADKITVLHLAPIELEVLVELRRSLRRPLRLVALGEAEFQKALSQAYQKSSSEAQQAVADIDADFDLSRLADEIPESADLMADEEDAPVIRLINAILSQAVRDQASDIHIETFENDLVIRFRIDGVLSEVLRPKRMLAPLLVSRLKVMAKLDIAEKRIPQDGRISIRLAGHAVDIRLSTNPTSYGERIVLRLLDKQAGQLELSQLNMAPAAQRGYQKTLAQIPTLFISAEQDGTFAGTKRGFTLNENINSKFISYKGEEHGHPLIEQDKSLVHNIVNWFDDNLKI